MKIVNLTPHEINIIGADNTVALIVPPSGIVARATSTRSIFGSVKVDGIDIPINKTTFGTVISLPEPAEDTIYVVSNITAQAVPNRDDVFIVDESVRDENGRIIGCRSLAHV